MALERFAQIFHDSKDSPPSLTHRASCLTEGFSAISSCLSAVCSRSSHTSEKKVPILRPATQQAPWP